MSERTSERQSISSPRKNATPLLPHSKPPLFGIADFFLSLSSSSSFFSFFLLFPSLLFFPPSLHRNASTTVIALSKQSLTRPDLTTEGPIILRVVRADEFSLPLPELFQLRALIFLFPLLLLSSPLSSSNRRARLISLSRPDLDIIFYAIYVERNESDDEDRSSVCGWKDWIIDDNKNNNNNNEKKRGEGKRGWARVVTRNVSEEHCCSVSPVQLGGDRMGEDTSNIA